MTTESGRNQCECDCTKILNGNEKEEVRGRIRKCETIEVCDLTTNASNNNDKITSIRKNYGGKEKKRTRVGKIGKI